MSLRRTVFVGLLAALALCACAEPVVPFPVDVRDVLADAHSDMNREGASDAPPGSDVVPFDAGPRCLATQVVCDGLCISVQIDANNCGTCGHMCGEGMACYAGVCHTACPTGLSACPDPSMDGGSEVCVDIMNSRLNCGTCGHTCPPTGTCSAGVCILDCGTRTLCSPGASDGGAGDGGTDPYCADLSFDSTNCGACGAACPPNHICDASHCVIDCAFPQVGCPPTGTMTASYCANTRTDANNCGSCGRTCPAGQTCNGGTCVCAAPALACGAACINPATDVNNCGACGRVCTAGQYCLAGACTTCAPRTLCPAGLCTDTNTDYANCGACGTSCRGAELCTAARCTCPTGAMVCGGICSNVLTDAANCGSCGRACPTGQFCSAGTCVTTISGYRQVASPPGVSFLDACAAPGVMTYLPTTDDSSVRVALPFPFRYWSADLPSGAMVNLCSNGWIGMDGVSNNALSGTVPSASTPNAVIAPHWGDNYNSSPGQCVATFGTAPNRRWVVEWQDAYYCCSRPAGTSLTYEVILSESTNTIDFVYRTISGARAQTMGIENQTGTVGVNACPGGTGTCIPTAGQVVRFVPM